LFAVVPKPTVRSVCEYGPLDVGGSVGDVGELLQAATAIRSAMRGSQRLISRVYTHRRRGFHTAGPNPADDPVWNFSTSHAAARRPVSNFRISPRRQPLRVIDRRRSR
jgi:hypothetical protein